MFKTKKKFLVAFLSLIVSTQYSCKKDTPIITDSVTTAEEMYSVGTASTTADMIQTSDGGYIMVGTSYANNDPHGDIVAIKTDSRGIQQWSTSMGKAAHQGTGSWAGYTVNYTDEGVKVVEELDGSFSIAGNRTYYIYANPNSPAGSGIREQTKIVLYKLSATGTATTTDGVELRSNSAFIDHVSDFKIDVSNGNTQYILTGYTTDVQPNKPNDNHNGAFDITDIFTVSLNANFDISWSSLTYGFSGQDYGTSIQILPTGYLVVGTSEEGTSGTSFNSRIIAVMFDKAGGIPMNVAYFKSQGVEFEGGYSVYDATNQLITIVGNVVASGAFSGQMAALQINDNLVQTLPSSASSSFEFINPTPPSATHTSNTFKASSIALIPNNGGFAISSTLSHSLGKDICITKLASDFSLPATGWPHYYGLADGFYSTSKLVGPVLPIVDVSGTVEYAYTGTFNANTSNSQIGWVLF